MSETYRRAEPGSEEHLELAHAIFELSVNPEKPYKPRTLQRRYENFITALTLNARRPDALPITDLLEIMADAAYQASGRAGEAGDNEAQQVFDNKQAGYLLVIEETVNQQSQATDPDRLPMGDGKGSMPTAA